MPKLFKAQTWVMMPDALGSLAKAEGTRLCKDCQPGSWVSVPWARPTPDSHLLERGEEFGAWASGLELNGQLPLPPGESQVIPNLGF